MSWHWTQNREGLTVRNSKAWQALGVTLVCLLLSPAVVAQHERDYINTDEDGHLIFRYAGNATAEASLEQMEEINNAFNSVMVHDRLRADIWFDEEERDSEWANYAEALLRSPTEQIGSSHSALRLECRSQSCRLIVAQSGVRTVDQHQIEMDELQQILQGFIADHPGIVDRVFLIAAYYQEREPPVIKVYLSRADSA